jgi:hypothetical protein
MEQRRRRRVVRDLAAIVAIGVEAVCYRRWHLRWGATDEEVSAPMPGDRDVPGAHFRATRAITIDAPAHFVWPWIVQIGAGRAGFYSYDLLDNLGHHSADHVLAAFQHVSVGDLAAPMTRSPSEHTSFRVRAFETNEFLVWTKPDSSWTWTLKALPGGRTRLVTRLLCRYDLRRPSTLATVALMEVGDFPMMRKELLGIRERAERLESRAHPVGRSVVDLRDRQRAGTGPAARPA